MTQDPGLASWLQLTLTPGLGNSAIRGMLRQFGLPQSILARRDAELGAFAMPAALEALRSEAVQLAVARALEWTAQPANRLITLAAAAHPRILLEIPDP